MTQIFQKHVEIALLTDPGAGTQTTVGTPYAFSNTYVPTVGCQILRGLTSSSAVATSLLALKNANSPMGGFELIVVNNLSTQVSFQITSAQLTPVPAATGNLLITIQGNSFAFIPGEWMAANTTFSVSTGTFNIDLVYWT